MPKFSGEDDGTKLIRESSSSIALSCSAQGFPVPSFRFVLIKLLFLEPIGGSVPKFSGEIDGSKIVRDHKSSIALTCSAQGFPVPSFRFVYIP